MRARVTVVLAALMLAMALAGAGKHAAAAPLEPEECGKLADEHKQLVGAGIEAELAKGPDWARAHLDAEGLDRLKRFLAIEEQLRFRCPLVRHVKAEDPVPNKKAEETLPKNTGPSVPLPVRNPERLAKASPSASVEPAAVKQN